MRFKPQLLFLIFCSGLCFGQEKSIAITIDDVDTPEERVEWLKQEPYLAEIQGTYQQILENNPYLNPGVIFTKTKPKHQTFTMTKIFL